MPVAGLPAELRFTASFGVAELKSGEELAELMLRADEALYIAKRDGRDRVRATPDVEKREQPRLRIVRD
jgi:PleD family two-component response regulator